MKLLLQQFVRGRLQKEPKPRTALGEGSLDGFSDRGSTPLISTSAEALNQNASAFMSVKIFTFTEIFHDLNKIRFF